MLAPMPVQMLVYQTHWALSTLAGLEGETPWASTVTVVSVDRCASTLSAGLLQSRTESFNR